MGGLISSNNPADWWKGGISSSLSSTSSTSPAYDRVSAIPSWLPPSDTHELADQYAKTGEMFDTKGYDDASEGQQSRVLTTALNAGNNAATDYANRARQAGGSGMGAGLIKAQATVGARKVAGDMELERQKFDASQREKAAGHAASIAQTLGQLRQSYLQTIVDYATKEDSTSADFKSRMAAVDATNAGTAESARQFNWKQPTGGQYQVDRLGKISGVAGTPFRDPNTGLPSNDSQFAPADRAWWG
jgi:uncharacterized membrane-anchored protein YhcB (DUF1043 family)